MRLKNINNRLKLIEKELLGGFDGEPFGERTAEIVLLVYVTRIQKAIVSDDDFLEVYPAKELRAKLDKMVIPLKLKRDINIEMQTNGILKDDTLEALSNLLFPTQPKKEGN